MSSELSLQTIAFADTFVDVAGLNAHVSARLGARIDDVLARARRGERAPANAIAILGAAGGGKTHIFARLRHDAALRATLILLRPFFGVNLGPRDVLATVIDQLCVPVRGGPLTQLDLLGAHWLGEREAMMANGSFPSATLEDVARLSAEERAARIDRAVSDVISCLPEAEPAAHLARSLLALALRDASGSAAERAARWAELAWLSGREPRTQDTGALSEADVAHLLRIVSVVAAPVAPLLLTFDQLENLAGDDEGRVLAYGNLVAELVDMVPSLTIAQLALTSEWMQFIEPRLTLPQKTRVANEVLILEPPDRAQRELLLRAWHTHLAPSNGRGGRRRFPSPLTADELDALLDAPGMTPRLLLTALARAVAGKAIASSAASPPSLPPAARFRSVWEDEYAKTLAELEEKAESGVAVDAAELAEGVTCALSYLPSLAIATRNERDRILTEVRSPDGTCTLLYLTGTHHRSVGSALGRSLELAQTQKTVIVRERRLELPTTWESVQVARASFECLPNARWLSLENEDVARFLTLARLSSRARAGRLRTTGSDETLTETALRASVRDQAPPEAWRPAASIVSWLSDVPRERAARPASPAVAPSAPSDVSSPSNPPPTLAAWMRMGGQIGKDAFHRYREKLRGLRVRGSGK